MKPTVGVAVITYTAKHLLPQCLPPLINSSLNPKVLVMNSSSNDGTVEEAERLGAQTHIVPRDTFNHGATRELARKLLGTDIVVMVTPDAFASSISTLETLVKPIIEGKASIAYARQIPHDNSTIFESFPRAFNYPSTSHTRSIDDAEMYGPYLFFCSNAFAAYSNQALDSIGGFPTVLLGEDTCAVAKLLRQGHKIAYVADAVVKHSHRYSLGQEFRRHFDTGLARTEFRDLILEGGKDESRGRTFALNLTLKIAKEKPYLLPYAIVQTLTKWFGYKLGCLSTAAPLWIKKAFTSQDFYWDSVYYSEIKRSKK